MPNWSPCKRQDFIRRMRQLGFEGVYSGSKHQFIVIGQNRLTLPSGSLQEGLKVSLHDEEMEAEGEVHYSGEERIWVAKIDWESIRQTST